MADAESRQETAPVASVASEVYVRSADDIDGDSKAEEVAIPNFTSPNGRHPQSQVKSQKGPRFASPPRTSSTVLSETTRSLGSPSVQLHSKYSFNGRRRYVDASYVGSFQWETPNAIGQPYPKNSLGFDSRHKGRQFSNQREMRVINGKVQNNVLARDNFLFVGDKFHDPPQKSFRQAYHQLWVENQMKKLQVQQTRRGRSLAQQRK